VKLPVLAWYAQRPIADTSARNIPAQRVGREGFEPSTLGLRVVGGGLATTREPCRTRMVELGRLGSPRTNSRALVDFALTLRGQQGRHAVVVDSAGNTSGSSLASTSLPRRVPRRTGYTTVHRGPRSACITPLEACRRCPHLRVCVRPDVPVSYRRRVVCLHNPQREG